MTPTNPDFDLPYAQARAIAKDLAARPPSHPRPLVVLDGWHSPYLPGLRLAARLASLTGQARRDVVAVSYPLAMSLEAAARRVMARLAKAQLLGREIDVVGVSMGGVLARAMAIGCVGPATGFCPRRVFTLASPHCGAILADVVSADRASRQLRAGSDVLRAIDESAAAYELTCYGVLRDWMVGCTRTAPPGRTPLWLAPSGPLAACMSHFSTVHDLRLAVDLALRLRGLPTRSREGAGPPRD